MRTGGIPHKGDFAIITPQVGVVILAISTLVHEGIVG